MNISIIQPNLTDCPICAKEKFTVTINGTTQEVVPLGTAIQMERSIKEAQHQNNHLQSRVKELEIHVNQYEC